MPGIVIATLKKPSVVGSSKTYYETLDIRPYVNDYTPVPGMVLADFVLCLDAGAIAQSAVFGAPYLNDDDEGQMDAATLTWTFAHNAGDFDCYGVVITDPADADKVVLAERAPGPPFFECLVAGQTWSYRWKYTRNGCEPPGA